MTNFIASGFTLDVPQQCQDASCYTFVFPTKQNFSPYLTIKFEQVLEGKKLVDFADEREAMLEDNVDNFKRVERVAGKQQGREAIISLIEWGAEEAKMKQRFIYLHNKTPQSDRFYVITATDLAANFRESLPLMNQIIKSFQFQDQQIFDLQVKA